MASVFISYRRADSPGTTGRLYDFLRQRLHGVDVFRDIYRLMPGVKYDDAIKRALQASGVLLAVIGPHWSDASDAKGRRLDDPADLLRREIATALTWNIPVIPVLVDGARMPAAQDLPHDLQPLRALQSITLSDDRWDHDAGLLLDAVAARLGLRIGATDQIMASSMTRGRGRAAGVTGFILFVVALAVGATIIVRVLLPTLQESGIWATFTEGFQEVDTSIELSKSSGPAGTVLTISGEGFRPGEEVVICFHGREVRRFDADEDGAFADVQIQVPIDWEFTDHFSFTAMGSSSNRSADRPFQVT